MRFVFSRRVGLSLLAVAALLSVSRTPAAAQGSGISLLNSLGPVGDRRHGPSIGTLLGADRFYAAGYTGARAVVANVEAGHVWNGHETLTQVNTYIDARGVPPYSNGLADPGQLGQFDFHATAVGQVIAGRDNGLGDPGVHNGIAYGTTLWSGAIATVWNTPQVGQTGFDFNKDVAFQYAYDTVLQSGVGGRTADVLNSSWSFTSPGGNDVFSVALDGMARQNRKTLVFSAGNDGPGANTVGGPGSGFNGIVVGATGTADGLYTSVTSFSSRAPQDYVGPLNGGGTETVLGARARVDIVAPGEDIVGVFYGGLTGGNAGGPADPLALSPSRYAAWDGTSFSAPIVAGGAALLADVAYDRFAANTANALDGNVIKAVLLNSADKLSGWTNGLAANGQGVLVTTQALDFAQGAGQMNLNKAFDQYTAGVTDVAGTGGGTSLATLGWDWGNVAENGSNDYRFATSLVAGSTFTATLNWYVKSSYNGLGPGALLSASFGSFTNLALELYRTLGAGGTQLVAQSDAAYLNTEHFALTIPETGDYFLRVRWTGERYDFINSTSQDYGLAWANTLVTAAAPEPGTFAFLFVGGLLAFGIWRRR